MATKPTPPTPPAKDTKSAESTVAAPAGKTPRKKIYIVLGVLMLILALVSGGIFYVLQKRAAATDAEDTTSGTPSHTTESAKKTSPPVYMPVDNMVINLSDEGGERVAQVGIIFELNETQDADRVKAFMPTIRHSILLALSKRTSVELLSPEGKKALTTEIIELAAIPFGGEVSPKKKKVTKDTTESENYPVTGVLFSSLIVQ